MKFSYRFSVEVPESFLKWLKAHGFRRVGRSFTWKSKKTSHRSCDHLTISMLPAVSSYKIALNWWEERNGEYDYYDTVEFSSFDNFLNGVKNYQL